MGQLTNQYVSQSYQGLLNLENPFTGVTSTLQYVTDGIGNKIPMQVSTSSVVITGSFRGDGTGLTGITANIPAGTVSGSQQIVELGFATTSSLNTLSGSIAVTDLAQNNRLNSLEGITGSLQNQINQKLDTGSFNTYSGNTLNLINTKLDSSSFNSYTSSNDSRVSSLESKTGSYATTGSNNFVGQQNINGSVNVTGSLHVTNEITALSASITYLETVYQTSSVIFTSGSNILGDEASDVQTLNGRVDIPLGNLNVSGATTSSLGFFGDLQGTASNATLLNGTGSGVFATTGSNSFYGNQNIYGDVTIDSPNPFGTFINLNDATQTSFNLNSPLTQFQSNGQIVFTNTLAGSGSDDLSFLAQNGGDINLNTFNSGSVIAGGKLIANNLNVSNDASITGSLNVNGQVNVATNLNVTQSLNVDGNSTFNNQTTYNGNIQYNSDSFIRSGSQINFNIGDGQDGRYYRLSRKFNGEFGIVQDPGNLHLLDISSSFAEFLPPTYFISGAFATGSLLVRSGSLSTISNNTTLNIDNFLTSSQGGQSNIIKGWGDNPTPSGPASLQGFYTGSLRITGSNNTVSMPQIRGTIFGGPTATDLQGYISGSDNTIASNNAGIYLNTGSLLFPKINNNYVGSTSAILMNFTTSSLAGGHPILQNNTLYAGNITFNSNSGSINAAANLLNGGSVGSIQNFVTNQRANMTTNLLNGASLTLNHISSSILYTSNISNASVTINNHLSSSIVQNTLSVGNNTFFGGSVSQGHSIWVSGSQSSNVTRAISDNLIGGRANIVSSSFVSSSNANLVSSIVYGNALAVSASHTTGTNGGSAFFGRFNMTGSNLEDAQSVVFAVGTGTSAAARRTGFLIDSGSNTRISGSLSVQGGSSLTGSLIVSGGNVSINGVTNVLTVTGSQNITHNIAGQAALTVVNSLGSGQPGLNVTGSLDVLGQISSNQSSGQEGGQVNLALAQTGNLLTGSIAFDVFESKVRLFEAGGTNRGGYFAINEMTTGVGSKLGPLNFGQFQNNSTLSGSANVSQSMVYDVTDFGFGVSLVSGSRITVADTGYYNVQFSAQLRQTGGGTANIHVWFKKNGTNIAESATRYTLSNNTYQVAALNFATQLNANDYVEVAWQSDDATTQILYEAPTGNIPAVPSVITTVSQIR